MLELLQDLLEESEVLEESAFEGEITALLEWICKLVNGNQAEICMQGIQILDSDRVLLKYIVCKPYRFAVQRIGTGKRNRSQFAHYHFLAFRIAGILYRDIASALFRKLPQTAYENPETVLYGYRARLSPARYRIRQAALKGQDARCAIRKFHRHGSAEKKIQPWQGGQSLFLPRLSPE